MRRRDFLCLIGGGVQGAAAIWPNAGWGQPVARRPLIAVLSAQSPIAGAPTVEALRTALSDFGLIDGKNVWLDIRFADGDPARLPGLANDLLAQQPDIIVAGSAPAAKAVHAATQTTPIVMNSIPDPVGIGLVKSLARPQTNVTGVWTAGGADALLGKRLSILKEIVPHLSKIGAMIASGDSTDASVFRLLPVAAAALDLSYSAYEVNNPTRLELALNEALGDKCQALFVSQNPFFFTRRVELAALVASARLPAIYGFREHVEAGGLISYGSSLAQAYRQMARLAVKILKGARPEDLPVEQAERFELVVNNKTAKAIGLTIPESFLVRADEVIE
jgi:putative ABC transport system substrate-binding protein